MTIEQCLTAYLLYYSMDYKGWQPGEAEFLGDLAAVFRPNNPPSFGEMWAEMKEHYKRRYLTT